MKDKTSHPEYCVWANMMQRCCNPKSTAYKNYGGRGITVCDSWRNFSGFFSDMGSRPTSNHQIERIDNDGGYSKENCRWATISEQARNRSNNFKITHNGKTQCLTDWAKETGIGDGTIYRRIKSRNWTIEEALTCSPRSRPLKVKNEKLFTCFGKTMNMTQWSKETGFGVGTIRSRLRKGMSFEQAISNIPTYIRSTNRMLTHDGKTLPLSEWSRITGLKKECIEARLARGMNDDDALTKPSIGKGGMLQKGNRPSCQYQYTFNGKTQSAKEWAIEVGIKHSTLCRRMREGWPPELALKPVIGRRFSLESARAERTTEKIPRVGT